MLHLIQLYNMVQDKSLFINLFNDLSYEIEEMGYLHLEDQMELINEMLDNHFGIYLESHKQLQMVTETILKRQGKLNILKSLP